MSKMEKHHIINYGKIQSLVKAEWSVIRTCQKLVQETWRKEYKIKKFPDSCCGILFQGNYAFASNGHFLVKVRTDGPSIDPSVHCFFYDYEKDEVIENFNPFLEHVGVSVEDMLTILQPWKLYNLKVRVGDLLNTVESNVAIVRHRREVAFHALYDSEFNILRTRLVHKKGNTQEASIPVYSFPNNGFPEFSINLSYLHKIIDIISPFYYVVDFCFNGGLHEPIIIKAKNRYRDAPDMRFAIGQYIIK